jgi:cytochrome c biogenesis protein ResB
MQAMKYGSTEPFYNFAQYLFREYRPQRSHLLHFNHSFRATGITTYLKNGGTLEKAAQMANHASTRTRQLYDRRREELSLDEVERIRV